MDAPVDPPVDPDTTTSTTTTTTSTSADTNLDKALADQQTHDYDSSDLELSSSDDDSESDDDDPVRHDDEDEDDLGPSEPRSKNEVTEIEVTMPVVKDIADMQVEPIGKIVNVLDKTVVVQQDTGSTVLDMGSLLVLVDDRQVLGEVFETFGPVEKPFYSVRFNSVEDMNGAVKGAVIGYVPAYERTQLVQVEQLKLIKGTDASNQYDEEVGADELEFSDDEKEMEYRRKTKKKKTNQRKRPLEDPTVPDGRRLQSYADITTTSTMQSQRAPPQHPDAMTALLDSYMTSQPAGQPQHTQPPQASLPPQQQQQAPPPHQQQQALPQQSPQQQQQQQQQAPSSSFFQSIRSLFSRAPPPS